MKEAMTNVIDMLTHMLTQVDFYGAFQKLLEQYKCIALHPKDITSKGTRFSCVSYQ